MKPPCIENKCLLYPICRTRQIIRCTPLHRYVVKGRNHIADADFQGQMKWWHENILPILNNVESISDENKCI